jgi:hypothetical protein
MDETKVKLVPLNSTEEFYKKLSDEGKITYLNGPEHIQADMEVNITMAEALRDYREIEKMSEISSFEVVLD